MDINDFISGLDVVFETTDISTITPETKFKELAEWDSMLALSLIAMVDNKYKVKVTGGDIRSSATIEDLFAVVKSKV